MRELLWKEGSEQRRGLLAALSTLLALFALAFLTSFLQRRFEGALEWVGVWARRAFPVLLFYGLLPLYSTAVGALPFVRERAGGEDFLLSLPLRRRTIFAARGIVALGYTLLFAAGAWIVQGLLWLLAGRPEGPILFPLEGWWQGLLATALGTLPFLAAGMLIGNVTQGPLAAVLWGLVSGAALLWFLLPAVALTQSFGWWLPPWALLCLSGTVLMATGALALHERGEGPFPSTGIYAAGGAVALLLVGSALFVGERLSVRPGEVEEVWPIEVSPDGSWVMVRPSGWGRRIWVLSAKARGPRPLPGMCASLLGFSADSARALLAHGSCRPGGPASLAWVSPEGQTRHIMELQDEWLVGEKTIAGTLWSPGGEALLTDADTLWVVPSTGDPAPSPAEPGPMATPVGWWGGMAVVIIVRDEGLKVQILDPWAPGGGRILPVTGTVWPLRVGRYMAMETIDSDLVLYDDETGEAASLTTNPGPWPPVWAHHLETLYYLDASSLFAWHPEVGSRLLLEEVWSFRVLPDGNRILVSLHGGEGGILHAGTRNLLPVVGVPGEILVDPYASGPSAVSRDGSTVACLHDDALWLVAVEDGSTRKLRDLPGALWVAWAGPDRLWVQSSPTGFAVLDIETGELSPRLSR